MLERLKSISVNYIMILFVVFFATFVLFCGFGRINFGQVDNKKGYTVVDSQGSKIHLLEKPQRIVSFAVGNDEILLELVGSKRLVGISPWSDNPAVSCISDQVRDIPYRVRQQNLEAILAIKADLLIVPDYVNDEVVRTLKDAGLKVYVCKTPKKLAEIKATISALGDAVDEQDKAQAIISNMESRLKVIQQKIENVPKQGRPKILRIQENGSYYAPDSSFMEICRLAGAVDATENLHYDSACILSQEEIVALNPDIFIIENWNYDGKHDPELLKASIVNNKAYVTTRAGKNKKVILIPANHLLTVSQYMVAAVEDIAKAIYPEAVKR